MLNRDQVPAAPVGVTGIIDYQDAAVAQRMASGAMNTDDATLLAHIASAIRRGHPQMRQGPVRPDRVVLVGSGPSLHETWPALRQAVWEGARLVTMNAAYQFCLDRNLRPQTQILLDARPSNARFVDPPVPQCNYVIASQCAPEVWDAVAGREHVWIWHPVLKADGPASDLLDAYYRGQWIGIGGGTTVATRALMLLRTCGYLRFELFGVDCCWVGGDHHALPQPENAADRRHRIRVAIGDQPARTFVCAGWMLKQFEDLMTILAANGAHLQVRAHGPGMLAYALEALGAGGTLDDLTLTEE